MGLFDGCLLASDIDNTLVANGYINPRVTEAIKYFVNEGGCFTLSTGRSVGALSPVLELLPKEAIGPCVVSNGCMVYDFKREQTLIEINVNDADKQVIYKVKERFPQIGIEIHSGKKVLVMNKNQEIVDHETYERLDSEEITCEQAEKRSWIKVLMASSTPEIFEEVKEFIYSTGLKESSLTYTNVSIDGRIRKYLELWQSGVNKATSLKALCDMLGIKKGCYFAIGDYYNDVEMIATADIGAATSDAPKDVKDAASYISCTAKDGAVADFINYLTVIISKN